MSDKTKFTRSDIRETTFKILFAKEFDREAAAEEYYSSFAEDSEEKCVDTVKNTFVAICEKKDELDSEIEKYSAKWKISRMSTASRSILRLAVYEMTSGDIPPKVAINEAVELAKKYDDEHAPSFVNGILNKLARERGLIASDAGEAKAEADAEAE